MLAMRPELVHGCTVATVLAGFDIPPWSDRFSVPEAKDGPHTFAMPVMRPELFHGCTVATVLAGFDIPPWSDRFSVPGAKAVTRRRPRVPKTCAQHVKNWGIAADGRKPPLPLMYPPPP